MRPLRLLLPLLIAPLVLALVEYASAPPQSRAEPVEAKAEQSRLIIFWIDSLARRDVAAGAPHMPKLRAREGRALHGPVRECADALSVACFAAMATGQDRFSLFNVWKNFGAAGGAPKGSLTRVLQAQGKRLGFIGDFEVGAAAKGFDWHRVEPEEDDGGAAARGIAALGPEKLDLLLVQFRTVDSVAHKQGPDHPRYAEALRVVDDAIEAAWAHLRPTDHVVVLGDHGHTVDGRHFAGLAVPTYAWLFGPAFDRPMRRPMAMTDHAALWARIFGLRFSERPWVRDYFEGGPVDTPEALPELAGGHQALPLWALGLGLLLLLLAALPERGLRPWFGALATLGFIALLVGLFWSDLRPLLYYRSRGFNTAICALVALIGGLALWPARRGGVWPAFMLGGVLLALPTVYKFGGAYCAIAALFVGTLAPAPRLLRERAFGLMGWTAATAALLWTLWNPAVRSFKLQWFPVYKETLEGALLPAILGMLVLLALATARPPAEREAGTRGWLAALAAGLLGAALLQHLPPRAAILPCALTPILVFGAHRWPRLTPLAFAFALPAWAFFLGFDLLRVAPIAAGLALWPLWARARPDAGPLERGVAIVVLTWLGLWVTCGCRIGGLDFNYFFTWLAEGARVEETAGLNGLLTTALYLSLPVAGLLLMRRASVAADYDLGMDVAERVALGRLGVMLCVVLGFFGATQAVGPFVTSDLVQEAATAVAVVLIGLGPALLRRRA